MFQKVDDVIVLLGGAKDFSLAEAIELRDSLNEAIADLQASAEPPLAVYLPCVCQRFDNGTKVFPNQICDGCRNSASH